MFAHLPTCFIFFIPFPTDLLGKLPTDFQKISVDLDKMHLSSFGQMDKDYADLGKFLGDLGKLHYDLEKIPADIVKVPILLIRQTFD